ncbi:class I SAM-dependent methyltransferase [Colwellia echini]|uniref:Methyltransferase domain-containing protein n=1 Tax=Colwellia echini TaxID=1982103 RepID=A0ABY3N0H6_9GAMM|nr:methyltransferase domain-containing protein [Colwellia echini]TYK66819.1 methyltransferase domain-containing protein [Colwellia echini]
MIKFDNHNSEVISQFTQQAIPFSQLVGHLDSLELLVQMSQVDLNSNVLDVASGPGLVATEFSKKCKNVECLDLTPAMLKQAKNRASEANILNMSFREGDAMNLPYEDNSFDVVLTRYSFHHFLTPEKALQEMIRVCKPGGRVVVADVAIEQRFMEQFNHIERLRDSSHVSALSLDKFEQLFSSEDLILCSKTQYSVDVELEKQLSVSFPKQGDDTKIRDLITQDVGNNSTGFNPKLINGDVFYSYPIFVYVGVKA